MLYFTFQLNVEQRLKSTWNWMYSIMDGTEPQLKFGTYLANYTDPAHPLHPLNVNTQNVSNQSTSSAAGVNMIGVIKVQQMKNHHL